MRILFAPLNWGLGHASRCIPLIRRSIAEGDDVVLGGDGDSLTLMRHHFPKLPYVRLAPLKLRYSRGNSQVGAMLRAIPQLLVWAHKDHMMLRALLHNEHFDRVISDNRFGLYALKTECIYITHQLHIRLPHPWRWLEPVATRVHARIYAHYNEVWIPDYATLEQSLAGELSHPAHSSTNHKPPILYISPLSRFSPMPSPSQTANHSLNQFTIALLSGLEPQRTRFEQELIDRFNHSGEPLILIRGLVNQPATTIKRGNITIIPHIEDAELAGLILKAKHIIARSGYSTIMDLAALGVLDKAELIPTPGQSEQEYLAEWLSRTRVL